MEPLTILKPPEEGRIVDLIAVTTIQTAFKSPASWPALQVEPYADETTERQLVIVPEVFEWIQLEYRPMLPATYSGGNPLEFRYQVARTLAADLFALESECVIAVIVHKNDDRHVQALVSWTELLLEALRDNGLDNEVLIVLGPWAAQSAEGRALLEAGRKDVISLDAMYARFFPRRGQPKSTQD